MTQNKHSSTKFFKRGLVTFLWNIWTFLIFLEQAILCTIHIRPLLSCFSVALFISVFSAMFRNDQHMKINNKENHYSPLHFWCSGGFAFEWEEKGSNGSGGWGIKMERRHEEKMTQIEPFHEMESTENQKKRRAQPTANKTLWCARLIHIVKNSIFLPE